MHHIYMPHVLPQIQSGLMCAAGIDAQVMISFRLMCASQQSLAIIPVLIPDNSCSLVRLYWCTQFTGQLSGDYLTLISDNSQSLTIVSWGTHFHLPSFPAQLGKHLCTDF
jgi:hypothetical protein